MKVTPARPRKVANQSSLFSNAALTGAKVRVRWGAMPDRIWDTSKWAGDVRQAKQYLKFTAKTRLKDGLAKTMAWIKQHG